MYIYYFVWTHIAASKFFNLDAQSKNATQNVRFHESHYVSQKRLVVCLSMVNRIHILDEVCGQVVRYSSRYPSREKHSHKYVQTKFKMKC